MSRAFASLFSAFVLFAAAPGVRAADEDPKAIIARAVKAHGGEEFLTKHMAARTQNKGKINVPGVGETDFTQEVAYMLPNKFRENIDLNVGGQNIKVSTLMNGDAISIEAAGKAVDVTDSIKKAMKDATEMMTMARLVPLLKDKTYELSVFGEAKVEEKPAIGIRVTSKSKKEITFYFDKKTNLLAKLEHRTVDAGTGAEISEERIVLEYKVKDGIPMPKKVLVKHDGKTFIEAEVVEFTYLEKIDDSEFKK